MSLTAVQQDYIETIYFLEQQPDLKKIRITDIAEKLGTKLPTVTRTVKKLTDLGYLKHKSHGGVNLTPKGLAIAGEIEHLHRDLILFFTKILGLDEKTAFDDACKLEHGFSPLTAQRLHEFLIHIKELKPKEKKIIDSFLEKASKSTKDFKHLPKTKIRGWRI